MTAPTAGGQPIQLVLGLGNPGPQYAKTRHNAGFLVLERVVRASGGEWQGQGIWDQAWFQAGDRRVLAARPLTYMNRSGLVARRLCDRLALDPAQLLVVLDDVALPLGRLRIRPWGGAGGHKGLISISEELGTDSFPRLRVGVGPAAPDEDLADFVLHPIESETWLSLLPNIERAAEAIAAICLDGLGAAMNRFNPDPAGTAGEGDPS